jgi:malate/lactate dehydrogenase
MVVYDGESLAGATYDFGNVANDADAEWTLTVKNEGKAVLEISKVQLFTAGLQVQLGKQRLEPGESTRLKVTAIGKELKKVRTRPRILMITNDPNNQKVVINIQK